MSTAIENFSGDLVTFHISAIELTFVVNSNNADYEVVKVTYPTLPNTQKARFGRIGVAATP